MRLPEITIDVEGTPVAIAALAVGGIVAIAYSPIQSEARILAIGALGQLAGGAAGVAIPRSAQRAIGGDQWARLANAPAAFPPEWGERV